MIDFIKRLLNKLRNNKELVKATSAGLPVVTTTVPSPVLAAPKITIPEQPVKKANNESKGKSSKNYRKRSKARPENSKTNN